MNHKERRRSSGNSSLSSVDSDCAFIEQLDGVVWEKGAHVQQNSPTRIRRGAKWGSDIMTDLNALRRFSEGGRRRSSGESRRRSSGDSSLRSSIDSNTSDSDKNSRSNSNVSATSSTASAECHGTRRSSSNASAASSNASDRHSDRDEIFDQMTINRIWHGSGEHRVLTWTLVSSAMVKCAVDQPVEFVVHSGGYLALLTVFISSCVALFTCWHRDCILVHVFRTTLCFVSAFAMYVSIYREMLLDDRLFADREFQDFQPVSQCDCELPSVPENDPAMAYGQKADQMVVSGIQQVVKPSFGLDSTVLSKKMCKAIEEGQQPQTRPAQNTELHPQLSEGIQASGMARLTATRHRFKGWATVAFALCVLSAATGIWVVYHRPISGIGYLCGSQSSEGERSGSNKQKQVSSFYMTVSVHALVASTPYLFLMYFIFNSISARPNIDQVDDELRTSDYSRKRKRKLEKQIKNRQRHSI